MKTIGFFFSCYKENEAVEYSISELRKYYPNNPIYLVSDGGNNFYYLETLFNNLKTTLEEDTMSDTFKITDKNWKEPIHQKNIKKASLAVLDRIENAINYCKTDYIVMMDPDTLIRGNLNIPDGVKLLGSKVNKGLPQGLKNVISSIKNAKTIDCWGATPGIFHTKTFLESVKIIKHDSNILDMMIKEFYAIYAHDLLLPIIFALVGEEETFNPDIIECNRCANWEMSEKPLVHQFKKYYQKGKF